MVTLNFGLRDDGKNDHLHTLIWIFLFFFDQQSMASQLVPACSLSCTFQDHFRAHKTLFSYYFKIKNSRVNFKIYTPMIYRVYHLPFQAPRSNVHGKRMLPIRSYTTNKFISAI